jgi:hypothetical protein
VGKKKLVVIWPYRFREFDWSRLELGELEEFCEIEVFDLAYFLNRRVIDKYSVGATRREVMQLSSYLELFREIKKLRRTNSVDVTIMSFVRESTFRSLACATLLKFGKSKIIWYLSGGNVPRVHSRTAIWLQRLKLYDLVHFLLRLRFLFCRPNAVLVGSQASSRIADILLPKQVKRIWGSSDDFSTFLKFDESKRVNQEVTKFGLFVDQGFPFFSTDLDSIKGSHVLTADDWYPKLNSFFEFVATSLGFSIRISAHPKHFHFDFSPIFNKRKVGFGDTVSQISYSQIVIAVSSTAISYAVLFLKPLVLVVSDQLLLFPYLRASVTRISVETGARIFNIDREYTEQDLREAMVIDHAKYESYKRKYLTSRTDGKPNYQVLLDEVIFAED